MFPESVLRYQIISNELLQSNLFPQSLDVARSGVKFNPRSANIWIYVLVNPAASLDEREKARQELMNLDPLNKEIQNYLVK
jgi:hypothetical protein